MVIYLTDSLITEDPKKIQDIKACIRNLCIAHSESKHLLFGDLEVLKWGMDNIGDETSKVVLARLIQEFSFSAISGDITEYVEVGDWQKKTIKIKDYRVTHMVPYKFFTDSGHCQMTNIIGEDENDVKLYVHILNWYTASKNYFFRYKREHGGGATMGRKITTTMQSDGFAIAIVDTDMRFCGDKIENNSTCYRCLEAYKAEHGKSVLRLYTLHVHEIENILPFKIVEELYEGKTHISEFKALLNLEDEVLRYFDIKKGIKLADGQKPEYRDFAKRCYSNNEALTAACEFSQKVAIWSADKTNREKQVLYPGLGGDVLKTVIAHYDTSDIGEVKPVLKPFQKREWNAIGKHLLNYCIARPKEALN